MTPLFIPLLALLAGQCILELPTEPNRPSRIGPMITALVVTPDDSGWLRGSQAGVVFHSIHDGRERAIPTALEHVHAMAFSPDRTTLALAGGSPAEAGAVELRAWPSGDLLGRLDGHEDVVYDLVWLEGGKSLATAGADRIVRVWNTESHREVAALEGHSGAVLALAAVPGGHWFCSGGADGTIRVWESGPWRSVRTLNNHLGPVHGLAFRPAQVEGSPATLASSGGDSTARIWQPGIGRMVRIIRHPAPLLCLAWNHDGSQLVTGAKDGHLRILDGGSDTILSESSLSIAPIRSIAVPAHDAPLIVGDSLGAIHAWRHKLWGAPRDVVR
ncbi:hypothetical protein V5E97_16835 [Singulisphaera sp. Ch08]|uniref:WD40 repeat domain-containing protein n=1 Tax=Singulisphaera sp. Ch08 TaxID=3120278 RepID=A0AAU7CRB4_9BACT